MANFLEWCHSFFGRPWAPLILCLNAVSADVKGVRSYKAFEESFSHILTFFMFIFEITHIPKEIHIPVIWPYIHRKGVWQPFL
jgi:hypothetical protein